MKYIISPLVALLLVCAVVSSCSRQEPFPGGYVSRSVEGRLIDGRTKITVPGAMVTANWELTDSTGTGSAQLVVLESVTDEHGKFHIPAWGPRPRPDGTILAAAAPRIVMFKNGYGFKQFDLAATVSADGVAYVTPTALNGKTIELEPFFGRGADGGPGAPWHVRLFRTATKAWRWVLESVSTGGGAANTVRAEVMDYAEHLQGLRAALRWIYEGRDCEWKSAPNMVAAVHRQAGEFKRFAIASDLPAIDALIPPPGAADKCNAREYFASYLASTEPLKPLMPVKLIGVGGGAFAGTATSQERK